MALPSYVTSFNNPNMQTRVVVPKNSNDPGEDGSLRWNIESNTLQLHNDVDWANIYVESDSNTFSNLIIENDLIVSNDLHVSNNIKIDNDLVVCGDIIGCNNLNISKTITTSNLIATNNVTIQGDITAISNLIVFNDIFGCNNMTIAKTATTSNLVATNNIIISNDLIVSNDAKINKELVVCEDIIGCNDLIISKISTTSNLVITNDGIVSNNFQINNVATIGVAAIVLGDIVGCNNLFVNKQISTSNLDVFYDTNIYGNLYVAGSTVTVESETLIVDDNILVLNSGPSITKDGGVLIHRWQNEGDNGTGDVVNDVIAKSGTFQGTGISSGLVVELDSGASAIDDTYNTYTLELIGGTGNGQTRTIVDYVGIGSNITANKYAYVSGGAFSPIPDATTVYDVKETILHTGTAQAGTTSTITLDAIGTPTTSGTDDFYNGMNITITSGTGSGQNKTISDYVGATKVVTVSSLWTIIPDATSIYTITQIIIHDSGTVKVNDYVNTMKLGSSGNETDDIYNTYILELTGGTGSGQTRTITDYIGNTKIVYVDSIWAIIPDGTTTYDIKETVSHNGTAQTGNTSTITLDNNGTPSTSITDDFYNGMSIDIIGGTGSGQNRTISDYGGINKLVTVSSVWTTVPDATSIYIITQVITHTSGTAGISSNKNTVFLDTTSNIGNSFYKNWYIKITNDSPVGVINQVRILTSYNGTTKEATTQTPWTIAPNNTTTYAFYNRVFVGAAFVEAFNDFVIGATTSDPGCDPIVVHDYLDLRAGNISAKYGLQVAENTNTNSLTVSTNATIGCDLTIDKVLSFDSNIGQLILPYYNIGNNPPDGAIRYYNGNLQVGINGTWITYLNSQFIPYLYNYQTYLQDSLILYGNTEIVTDTILTVGHTGNYKCELNSQISLSLSLLGPTNNQLADKLNELVDTLTNLTYQTHAPAFGAGEILLAGNYYTSGAGTMTGTLTFSGSATDVFVIYCGASFAVAASSQIILQGGAVVENVFIRAHGAIAIGAVAIVSGIIIASTGAVSLGAGCIMEEGRLLAVFGAISFGAGALMNAIPDNDSSTIDIGILNTCMIFSSAGAVSRTGTQTIYGDVRTNNGIVSGFGAPWDGTYTPTTIEPVIETDTIPIVKVRFGLYINSILNILSQRIIERSITEFENFSLTCFTDMLLNDIIDLRAEVLTENAAITFKTRSFSATLQYQ
jgi:predicted acyltransferase (DUF342 family)